MVDGFSRHLQTINFKYELWIEGMLPPPWSYDLLKVEPKSGSISHEYVQKTIFVFLTFQRLTLRAEKYNDNVLAGLGNFFSLIGFQFPEFIHQTLRIFPTHLSAHPNPSKKQLKTMKALDVYFLSVVAHRRKLFCGR